MSLATETIYKRILKSKRYTLQRPQMLFYLESSNVYTEVTSLL